MLRMMRGLLAIGVLCVALPVAAADDAKDGSVANPKYKAWAGFKPGATAVLVEKNVLSGEDKAAFPGGVDEKVITYTLLSTSDKQVVIRVVVVEHEHLGTIESAPTKVTYPAEVKKSHLEAVLFEFSAKFKDELEAVKVGGKEIKCKVVAGTTKKEADTIDYKLFYSDTVPGGIVKRTRVAKQGGKTVAETTILLQSFRDGTPKAPKK